MYRRVIGNTLNSLLTTGKCIKRYSDQSIRNGEQKELKTATLKTECDLGTSRTSHTTSGKPDVDLFTDKDGPILLYESPPYNTKHILFTGIGATSAMAISSIYSIIKGYNWYAFILTDLTVFGAFVTYVFYKDHTRLVRKMILDTSGAKITCFNFFSNEPKTIEIIDLQNDKYREVWSKGKISGIANDTKGFELGLYLNDSNVFTYDIEILKSILKGKSIKISKGNNIS